MSPHPCSGRIPLTPAVRHWTTGWPTAQRDIARSDSFCTGPINAGPHHRRLGSGCQTVFLNEDEQLEQLHRCLTDSTIDIDLRAGGALMLLYESIGSGYLRLLVSRSLNDRRSLSQPDRSRTLAAVHPGRVALAASMPSSPLDAAGIGNLDRIAFPLPNTESAGRCRHIREST